MLDHFPDRPGQGLTPDLMALTIRQMQVMTAKRATLTSMISMFDTSFMVNSVERAVSRLAQVQEEVSESDGYSVSTERVAANEVTNAHPDGSVGALILQCVEIPRCQDFLGLGRVAVAWIVRVELLKVECLLEILEPLPLRDYLVAIDRLLFLAGHGDSTGFQ